MKNIDLRSVWVLLHIYVLVTFFTIAIAYYVGAPYVLIFRHTGEIMLAVALYIGLLGIAWDGSLIIAGLIFETWRRWGPYGHKFTMTVDSTRNVRFFSHGLTPLILIFITSFIIYCTGNITLISLKLIGNTTEWRDPFFWAIEGRVLEWIAGFPINTNAWDKLYHSAWGIELFAAFVLVVLGRSSKVVLSYCVSMILLFYIGRFLGVLSPVMGPAFFKPELFNFLDGSITDTVMQRVAEVMASGPAASKDRSGILLGGVSAMPSLHLGMVTLTAYWLAIEKRWTLYMTVPWVLLVWMSTIVLGWHYILDGAGGIMLGVICVWITQWILQDSKTSPIAALSNSVTSIVVNTFRTFR